ncbi:MAG: TIGR00730 family Rossman fold protein [Planctomycetia bacterium]
MKLRRLCVFCGSRSGTRLEYAEAARELGRRMAEHQIELVFGGGKVGLMGIVADSVLKHGGSAVGIIPRGLLEREVGHTGLTRLEVVQTMHERKARMAELSDGFVALPGGYGTYEEICEVVTWAQLGIHYKPCVLVDVAGYWQTLIAQIDSGVREGFVDPTMRSLLTSASTLDQLFQQFEQSQPAPVQRWMGLRDS